MNSFKMTFTCAVVRMLYSWTAFTLPHNLVGTFVETYMLSQNFFCMLGLSWFRRIRNHLCIFRTSQSSCLESPSSCLVSGHWRGQYTTITNDLLSVISTCKTIIPVGVAVTPQEVFSEHIIMCYNVWRNIWWTTELTWALCTVLDWYSPSRTVLGGACRGTPAWIWSMWAQGLATSLYTHAQRQKREGGDREVVWY